jgi:F-type H+-transporting ATPase subunit epsilon
VVVRGLKVETLLIPTIKGQIQVLPDHTHIVETLCTGILKAKLLQESNHRYFSITTGLVKIQGTQVTILSHVCEALDKIDLDRAKKALELAQLKLAKTDELSDIEIIKYQRKLERAKMRMEMAYLRG